MSDGALRGVRVLDAATLYPAPLLAAMLGDLGADVVKVEGPRGDPLRAMGAAPWSVAARNKRSVVVDFDTDDGLSMLHRLIAVTDVVVFNQPASVLARWGCTDDDVIGRNRRAIVVHVSAFGSSGPYAGRAGNSTVAEAFVGLSADTGVPLGDTAGAVHGVTGVLAALYWRDHAGEGAGRVVDVSLYEALLPLLGPALAGVERGRMVRDRYVARDRRSIAISATTPAQVARLDELTGSDAAGWVASRTGGDAVDQLVAARVPAVVVNDLAGLRADPHIVARGSIAAPPRAAPALGEHTSEVVEEWLHEGRD